MNDQPTAARVLVVDDDPTVSDVVRRYLERAGFAVDNAGDGPTALALAALRSPDLVVLDLMLPGMSGLEVCRRLRRESDVPVVMLTALGEESDRVVGFETGADDYVTKPFSPRELIARIRAVARRQRAADGPDCKTQVKVGDLEIDRHRFEVRMKGKPIELTPKEVDVHVARLRAKFTVARLPPPGIETVRGVGYRFRDAGRP